MIGGETVTKERLRTYRDLRRELRQIERKVEAIETSLYSPKIPRLTGMPAAPGGGNAKEDMVAEHLELLDHYKAKKAELATEQLAIEKAIDSLPYRERTMLRLYYIDGLTWEDVCVQMSYSWKWVHQIHSDALQKLKKFEETSE